MTKREILEELKRDELIAAVESFELDVADWRVSQVTKASRMTDLTDRHEQALYERVAQIIEAARAHVSRTVNTAMVLAYLCSSSRY